MQTTKYPWQAPSAKTHSVCSVLFMIRMLRNKLCCVSMHGCACKCTPESIANFAPSPLSWKHPQPNAGIIARPPGFEERPALSWNNLWLQPPVQKELADDVGLTKQIIHPRTRSSSRRAWYAKDLPVTTLILRDSALRK